MENNNNKLTKVTAEQKAYKEAKKIYEETPEDKIYEKAKTAYEKVWTESWEAVDEVKKAYALLPEFNVEESTFETPEYKALDKAWKKTERTDKALDEAWNAYEKAWNAVKQTPEYKAYEKAKMAFEFV